MAHKEGGRNHRGEILEAAVPPALIGWCDNEGASMKKTPTLLAIYIVYIYSFDGK